LKLLEKKEIKEATEGPLTQIQLFFDENKEVLQALTLSKLESRLNVWKVS